MAKTTVEYSGVSSLHGIHYIFESGRKLYISKVIWLLVVLVFTGLGIIWSIEAGLVTYMYILKLKKRRQGNFSYIPSIFQAYEDWQSHPTINHLQTTGLPLSDIDFPSITICGQGSIYEV